MSCIRLLGERLSCPYLDVIFPPFLLFISSRHWTFCQAWWSCHMFTLDHFFYLSNSNVKLNICLNKYATWTWMLFLGWVKGFAAFCYVTETVQTVKATYWICKYRDSRWADTLCIVSHRVLVESCTDKREASFNSVTGQ